MTNEDIALQFSQIADLLEIKGENAFRINNYRRAARTIEELNEDLNAIAARKELSRLPGIGKSAAAKIEELLTTGKLAFRDQLTRQIPESTLELLDIPGLGPKKVGLLFQTRGVDSIASLESAIDAGNLDDLKGFGKQTLASVRAGIDFLKNAAGRTRLGEAAAAAEELRQYASQLAGVSRVEIAGAIRRGCETVGGLDLVCIADDPRTAVEQFKKSPGLRETLSSMPNHAGALLERPARRALRTNFYAAPADCFGSFWQYYTGSRAHNDRLATLARRRGLRIENGLLFEQQSKKPLTIRSEEEFYATLGLAWFPPELREDRGEIDAGAPPADLLKPEDLRGDLHMHTRASDGRGTVEEMALAGRALGYDYICISDHSQSSVVANGLSPERLEALIEETRAVDRRIEGIEVWIGSEVDIRADGKLDYEDELLARLDFVTASIHMGLSRDLKTNTDRTLAAIHNPYVNSIGHPTGRMINARKPMQLDLEEIFRAAATTGTALEINAGEYRLDLKDEHARMARDSGAPIVVCTDAHGPEKLARISNGVSVARRAWLRREDVLNTSGADGVRDFVRAKRGTK